MKTIEQLVRPNILSLKPYSSARDEFTGKKGIFLDANENPYGSLNRYPDPYQTELKNKITTFNNIPIENIFIGNGSDEVIDLTFRIFCEPGKDKALCFTPTYGMYEVSANINNISLIKLPLDKDFQPDLEKIDSYLADEDLKLIFICSPNNPTGNSINIEIIKSIAQKFSGIVLIDEAYAEFSKKQSAITLLKEFPNLIVCRTFSKAWGLASARVGIAYASSLLISFYNKVKPPYNVSTINQQAAIKAYDNINDFNTTLNIIINEREKLTKLLLDISIVKKIYPSDANFLLTEFTDANKTYHYLEERGIIVRDRSSMVKNCLRITVGTPSENSKLLEILKKYNL